MPIDLHQEFDRVYGDGRVAAPSPHELWDRGRRQRARRRLLTGLAAATASVALVAGAIGIAASGTSSPAPVVSGPDAGSGQAPAPTAAPGAADGEDETEAERAVEGSGRDPAVERALAELDEPPFDGARLVDGPAGSEATRAWYASDGAVEAHLQSFEADACGYLTEQVATVERAYDEDGPAQATGAQNPWYVVLNEYLGGRGDGLHVGFRYACTGEGSNPFPPDPAADGWTAGDAPVDLSPLSIDEQSDGPQWYLEQPGELVGAEAFVERLGSQQALEQTCGHVSERYEAAVQTSGDEVRPEDVAHHLLRGEGVVGGDGLSFALAQVCGLPGA